MSPSTFRRREDNYFSDLLVKIEYAPVSLIREENISRPFVGKSNVLRPLVLNTRNKKFPGEPQT